ncbi:hypothetical protein U9M48_024261, partial [Paspalum notatum var. saurae]
MDVVTEAMRELSRVHTLEVVVTPIVLMISLEGYQGPLKEMIPFGYNNSYQKSLEMVAFEALYGRRCRTPLNWSEPGERVIFGPELVTTAKEQSYADKRRRPLTFEVGNSVYLKVSPMKGVHRFGVTGKLAPRYIGPFPIIEKCGPVAYHLELPPHLSAVHNVFHVSQLKKCLRNLIWFIRNVQVKYWIPKKEQPDNEPSSSTRFNGRTILRMKLHGNLSISCNLNILSFGEGLNKAPS